MSVPYTNALQHLPRGTLTLSQRAVLRALSDHEHPERGCWPSRERIANETGLSVYGVQLALNHLVEHGFISHQRCTARLREQLRGRGLFQSGKGCHGQAGGSHYALNYDRIEGLLPDGHDVLRRKLRDCAARQPSANKPDAERQQLGCPREAADDSNFAFCRDAATTATPTAQRQQLHAANDSNWVAPNLQEELSMGTFNAEELRAAHAPRAENPHAATEAVKVSNPSPSQPSSTTGVVSNSAGATADANEGRQDASSQRGASLWDGSLSRTFADLGRPAMPSRPATRTGAIARLSDEERAGQQRRKAWRREQLRSVR
jgi:hypothetical protein